MSCPDNLLLASRRGSLSPEEDVRLAGHLHACPSCRLALQLGTDFDAVLHTQPDDDLIAARLARKLGPKLQKSGAEQGSALKRYAWVAVISLALLGGAGVAAASLGAWPFTVWAPPTRDAHRRPAPKNRAPVTQNPPEAVTVQAPEPIPETARVEAPVRAVPSARELFAQANQKRSQGDPRRARSLYRELQQRYPRSSEVEVSYVSLGRVHLELGEPQAALTQFDRYLAKHSRGPLTEEALFGKASALSSLHRTRDEQRTWQNLLAAFPASLYAERGRHRLEVLANEATRLQSSQ